MLRWVYCGLCRLVCLWGWAHEFLSEGGYPLCPWDECPYGVKE